MSRRYAVSMASLLPMSWGPGGLARAAQYVEKRGMYLQALPLLGIHLGAPKNPRILSIEGAWHPRSEYLLGALWRTVFPTADQFPTLMDFLLFGSGHRARLNWLVKNSSKALLIGHAPPCTWLEISPELRKYKPREQTMLQWIMSLGNPVVLDTYHVRRSGRFGESPVFGDNWFPSIQRLVMFSMIGLIHFQPKRGTDELKRFMSWEPTGLERTLAALRPARAAPVVLELAPQDSLKYDLADVRDRISEILD